MQEAMGFTYEIEAAYSIFRLMANRREDGAA